MWVSRNKYNTKTEVLANAEQELDKMLKAHESQEHLESVIKLIDYIKKQPEDSIFIPNLHIEV